MFCTVECGFAPRDPFSISPTVLFDDIEMTAKRTRTISVGSLARSQSDRKDRERNGPIQRKMSIRLRSVHPAFAIFCGLFLVAEIAFLVRGDKGDFVQTLAEAAIFGIFALLTYHFTAKSESAPAPTQPKPIIRQALQVGLCIAVFVMSTFLTDGRWNSSGSYLGPSPHIAWYQLWTIITGPADWFIMHVVRSPSIALGLSNLFNDVVIIGVALLLLGVPLRELGFYQFAQGAWKVLVTWLIIPIGFFVLWVAIGRVSVPGLLSILFRNLLQNGFSEEFLWRGAIFGRLRTIFTDQWALLIQALAFGLWHFGPDMGGKHPDIVLGVAAMIAGQATFGYAMGFVYLRTRNLLVPTLFHLAFDSIGAIIG